MEKELYSFNFRSHPDRLLVEHLQGVADICREIIEEKRIHWNGNEEKKLFIDILLLSAWCHDLGKATFAFQRYLKLSEDGQREKTRLSQHQALSALLAYWIIQQYLTKTKSTYKYAHYLPLIAFLWVKKHHGNLLNLFDPEEGRDELYRIDEDLITQQLRDVDKLEIDYIIKNIGYQFDLDLSFRNFVNEWRRVNCEINHMGKTLFKTLKKRSDIRLYLLFQWLYSILLTADKSHAIWGSLPKSQKDGLSLQTSKDYHHRKYSGLADSVSKLRNNAYRNCLQMAEKIGLGNHFLVLNIPTGSGKTLAGLGAALVLQQRLKEKRKSPVRILYCLPFLSIIDQNFAVFSEVFNCTDSSILLKHHSLTEMKYTMEAKEFDTDEASFLIEGWEAELVVTTFVQFFHTIVGNRNMMVRRFHQLTGSIIILDEIQTLPYRYWPLLELLFTQMAELLDCYFIIMTATLPRLISKDKCVPLVLDSQKYFQQFDRYHVILKLEPITIVELSKHVKEIANLHTNESILIVVNTTRVAQELFRLLKPEIESYTFFHLSTRVVPKVRLDRIREIRNLNYPKIVVSTQLVEAGVDLDFQRVIRDFAPLDSLNQVAGRCNRHGSHERGVVEFVHLVSENGRPYYQFVYGKEDLVKIFTSKDIIKDMSELSEREFLNIIDKYYDIIKQGQSEDFAEEIYESMGRLAFARLADFKLIQDDYPTASIYIPVDETGQELWNKFVALKKLKEPYEKRKQFLEIKPSLMEYVISIPQNLLPKEIEGLGGIYYLKPNLFDDYYDSELGFVSVSDEQTGTFLF